MIWLYSAAPTVLIDAPSNRRVWRHAWMLSGLAALATLASLRVVAERSGQAWAILTSYALLPIVTLMIGVAFAVMATGHARLWLLHVCAPPAMLTALLSGIGATWPTAWVLSWAVGVPLLLGILLSSACAVWVVNGAVRITREHSSRRAAGPSSELPVLRLQNRARLIRLTAATGCLFLAIATPLFLRALGGGVGDAAGLALLFGALACMRFEAVLLCLLRRPLVVLDGQSTRATYAGRWALFAPATSLLPLMINEQCAARASIALMALLREGSLGPAVRRASARLTPHQAERLSLSLSLLPGGAGAIRYLSTEFPEQIQAIASAYARLADEAATPPDLQRWLAALTDHPGFVTLAETGLAPERAVTLANAREALLGYSDASAITRAVSGLQQTILTLYGTIGPTRETGSPPGWPQVLLARITAHGRRLGAIGDAGSDFAD